jgi:hypothetical protein
MAKPVLILGAGFSRAVFDRFPLTRDLYELTKRYIEQEHERISRSQLERCLAILNQRQGDEGSSQSELLELLMTYLISSQPWKDADELLSDEALFIRLIKKLTDHLENEEGRVFQGFSTLPEWPKTLVTTLHQHRVPVISFNYDTIIERLVYKFRQLIRDEYGVMSSHLYRLPILDLSIRDIEGGSVGHGYAESFHLIKLHGSINWLFNLNRTSQESLVFQRIVASDSPKLDLFDRYRGDCDQETERRREQAKKRIIGNMLPFIIPPMSEKSGYYSHNIIQQIWSYARHAITEATEIYVMGYSLPTTDITSRLLFKEVANRQDLKVFLVNNDNSSELKDRFKSVMPNAEFIHDFLDPSGTGVAQAINHLAESLVNQ